MARNELITVREAATCKCHSSINEALSTPRSEGGAEERKGRTREKEDLQTVDDGLNRAGLDVSHIPPLLELFSISETNRESGTAAHAPARV